MSSDFVTLTPRLNSDGLGGEVDWYRKAYDDLYPTINRCYIHNGCVHTYYDENGGYHTTSTGLNHAVTGTHDYEYKHPKLNHRGKYGANPGNYSALPNCVGYAVGRAIECWGHFDDPSYSSDEERMETYGYKVAKKVRAYNGCQVAYWTYHDNKDYFFYSTNKNDVQPGAIVSFNGSTSNSCGHVVFIEDILDDGTVVIGESGAWSCLWKTRTVKNVQSLSNFKDMVIPKDISFSKSSYYISCDKTYGDVLTTGPLQLTWSKSLT